MSGCMVLGKRFQILLSTFNGEQYLRDQLDSYLQLDNVEQCCVLIRDDGSSDSTPEILQEYSVNYGFLIEYGQNRGITESYLWLLQNRDMSCDYFAFSDQDDVWLPPKLCIAMNMMEKLPPDRPVLFGSLSHIVDRELQDLGSSTFPTRGISYFNAMIQNVIPGHTQVINNCLADLLLERGFADIHVIDWWFYLVASSVGTVLFYQEYTVLHRQHGNNAVGVQKALLPNLLRRLQYIREGRGNAFSRQLWSFYQRYCDLLSQEYLDETTRFFSHMGSFFSRERYLSHCRVYRQGRGENLLFRMLYLLGKYNC